jgi:hypothetical protein
MKYKIQVIKWNIFQIQVLKFHDQNTIFKLLITNYNKWNPHIN